MIALCRCRRCGDEWEEEAHPVQCIAGCPGHVVYCCAACRLVARSIRERFENLRFVEHWLTPDGRGVPPWGMGSMRRPDNMNTEVATCFGACFYEVAFHAAQDREAA